LASYCTEDAILSKLYLDFFGKYNLNLAANQELSKELFIKLSKDYNALPILFKYHLDYFTIDEVSSYLYNINIEKYDILIGIIYKSIYFTLLDEIIKFNDIRNFRLISLFYNLSHRDMLLLLNNNDYDIKVNILLNLSLKNSNYREMLHNQVIKDIVIRKYL
jgi:hypothetical protein